MRNALTKKTSASLSLVNLSFWSIFLYSLLRGAARNFSVLGRLLAWNKGSLKNISSRHERKVKIRAFFFQNQGTFFNFPKKVRGDLPPPNSRYCTPAPDQPKSLSDKLGKNRVHQVERNWYLYYKMLYIFWQIFLCKKIKTFIVSF